MNEQAQRSTASLLWSVVTCILDRMTSLNNVGAVTRRLKLVAAIAMSRFQVATKVPGAVASLIVTESGQFLVPIGDVFVARRLGRDGGHDSHVLSAALASTSSGSDVVVVGAHVGSHAIPLARQGRNVAVVEANPATFELLTANARINEVEFHGSINAAAASTPGHVEIWANIVNTGGSKIIQARRRFEYTYDRPKAVVVQKMILDKWEGIRQMKNALIIMDVEGSECDALTGMTELLQSCSGLIMEVSPFALRDADSVGELQELLARNFSKAWNTADPSERYEPEHVVLSVESHHGSFASIDVQFSN
jgi:FkbM family methyltransferase